MTDPYKGAEWSLLLFFGVLFAFIVVLFAKVGTLRQEQASLCPHRSVLIASGFVACVDPETRVLSLPSTSVPEKRP